MEWRKENTFAAGMGMLGCSCLEQLGFTPVCTSNQEYINELVSRGCGGGEAENTREGSAGALGTVDDGDGG